MNDNELITVVRESFTGVHSTTPAGEIISHGRWVRARRRIPALAAALASVAGAVVLAVTASAPAGRRPGPQGGVHLAAWTVTRQADGAVQVTIRELTDPAGLQSKLRTEGLPASVTLIGHKNPACRPYPASPALLHRVFSHTFEYTGPARQDPPATTPPQGGMAFVLVIHPSALPSGAGVQIASVFSPPSHGRQGGGTLQRFLVYASPGCTSG